MNEYVLITDPIEILAGTNNKILPAYMEAAKTIESDSTKSMGYLKNFITSIEKVYSAGGKDSRIVSSKGNISQFMGYDNIKFAIDFLDKNLSKIGIVKDLVNIHDKLVEFTSQYVDGYNKQIRLVMLEYESALYLLVTGLSSVMANCIEFVQNGKEVTIRYNNYNDKGIISKSIIGLSRQLMDKSHKEYLNELTSFKDKVPVNDEIKEQTIMESAIGDTLSLIGSILKSVGKIGTMTKRIFTSIKQSVFGILPLIQSILYLKYKKKADTILALDQQVQFIEMNIDQLKNMKNMDPNKKAVIIKKQMAYIEQYKKKASKLRAELSETENEAQTAVDNSNKEIKQTPSDDEFIID